MGQRKCPDYRGVVISYVSRVEKYTSMVFLPASAWFHSLSGYIGFPIADNLVSLQGISIEEAEEKLLTILKQVMEEKLTATNIEVLRG